MCREWLYGSVRLPNGCAASKTCDLQPFYAISNAETGPEFASASAGFLMGVEETPGPVYGFGNPPNKIYKEAFLSGSQRENPYSYQGL